LSESILLVAADGMLLLHALFVAFVVIGLLLVLIGSARNWPWIRNPWFRIAHLAAIAVVVVQTWLGEACPLTAWEMALRAKAGAGVYSGSFIGHWLQTLLYFDFPDWVFLACYTIFGLIVAASWWLIPPRGFSMGRGQRSKQG
jgi:hypothetical protein